MADDLVSNLKNIGGAVQKGAQALVDTASAVATPVLKAAGVDTEPAQPKVNQYGYNRDGSPPTVKVDDSVTRKPF